MTEMLVMKVAAVREDFSNEIVDALIVQEDKLKKINLIAELSKKWPPYLYNYEVMISDDLNSYFSSYDIQRIIHFAQANSEGKNIPAPKATKTKIDLSNPNSLKQYKKLMVRCTNPIRGNVLAVSGEAYHKIFDKSVLENLKVVSRSGRKVAVVAGPIISVPDSFKDNEHKDKGSIIPKIAKLKNTELYYSDSRQSLHYRIGGDDCVYVEDPHHPGARNRTGWFFEKDSLATRQFKQMFDISIRSKIIRKSTKPEKDFLFLTDSELDQVGKAARHEAEQGGIPYDQCTKEDFIRIIKEYKIL